jgi:hypothetical protein
LHGVDAQKTSPENPVLTLPLPLLHPCEAQRMEVQHSLPQGALLAVARGEAWWCNGPHLPLGQSWKHGAFPPLWLCPPLLTWPPPARDSPQWHAEQRSLSGEDRLLPMEVFTMTGGQGLLAMQRSMPDLHLLQSLPLQHGALQPLKRHVQVWTRLVSLHAPASLLWQAHRGAQCMLEQATTSQSGAPLQTAA